MPEELWMEVHDIVQEAVIRPFPRNRNAKKAKWLSDEALQITVQRREGKGYPLWPREFRGPYNPQGGKESDTDTTK